MLGKISQSGCSPPSIWGLKPSSPVPDIRRNITRGCTVSVILGVISTSRPRNIKKSITGWMYTPCHIGSNISLSPRWILGTISQTGCVPPALQGAHWPGPRRRPRPQQGAGPRGAGQPPPCGLALESPHRLAPPADYRQRARGTSPSP